MMLVIKEGTPRSPVAAVKSVKSIQEHLRTSPRKQIIDIALSGHPCDEKPPLFHVLLQLSFTERLTYSPRERQSN